MNGCLAATCVFDKRNDFCKGAVAARLSYAHSHVSAYVDSAADDRFAYGMLPRQTFTAYRAFVGKATAEFHNAVRRETHACLDNHNVARLYVFAVRFRFVAVNVQQCFLRCQFAQFVESVACFCFAAPLEVFAEVDKSKYHSGRFEVQHMVVPGNGVHVFRVARHRPLTEIETHKQGYDNCVHRAGSCAHCDKAVHVGRTLKQTFEPHHKVVAVDIPHRQAQQQLYQCETYGIGVSAEKIGQRQPYHRAHGYVHQHNTEAYAYKQP